jgi:hypothetical protein
VISSRLVRHIESHHEQIAARVLKRLQREADLLGLGTYPEPNLREACREIPGSLGTLLLKPDGELAEHYERLGQSGFDQGFALHEMVHAYQIIHEEMIQYVRDEGMTDTTFDLYAHEELERGLGRLFDAIIFHMVRGYVRAMRNRTTAAAAHTRRRAS